MERRDAAIRVLRAELNNTLLDLDYLGHPQQEEHYLGMIRHMERLNKAFSDLQNVVPQWWKNLAATSK